MLLSLRLSMGRRVATATAILFLASLVPATAQLAMGGNPDLIERTGEAGSEHTPVSARNALARAEYSPNLNGFQSAVEAGDLAAIPLYQASGLELGGDTVRGYVNPLYRHNDTFDPDVARQLLRGGINRKAFCLDEGGRWDHYFVAERGLEFPEERTAFIRGLCATDETRLAVGALLDAEVLKLQAQEIANAARDGKIESCVADYKLTHTMADTLLEAEGFSLFELDTVTPPHDTVLMELSSWDLSGRKTTPEEAFEIAVANGCRAAHPSHVINTAQKLKLEAVMAMIGPAGESAPFNPSLELRDGG